eukprot:scaffold55567_cov28-Tisochrysis_lutea.AAC.8
MRLRRRSPWASIAPRATGSSHWQLFMSSRDPSSCSVTPGGPTGGSGTHWSSDEAQTSPNPTIESSGRRWGTERRAACTPFASSKIPMGGAAVSHSSCSTQRSSCAKRGGKKTPRASMAALSLEVSAPGDRASSDAIAVASACVLWTSNGAQDSGNAKP